MEYLEAENKRLAEELRIANEQLLELRNENMQLKAQVKDPSLKIKPIANNGADESTFITKGASNPTVVC